MGNNQPIFKPKELDDYKKVTYLNEKELDLCFKKFSEFFGIHGEIDLSVKKRKIDFEQFENSPDFRANPFKRRIFEVFSSDGQTMSFDDYINMMSVFSDSAPATIKCRYAFKIYKFTESKSRHKESLETEDIKILISRLIGRDNQIEKEDMKLLVNKIFEEADIDRNAKISLEEFEFIVLKSSEFAMNFCIRL